MTTLTSRVFNQDTGKAKNAARNGPVIITDRGRPSFVLLTFDEYERITNTQPNLVDLLAMSEEHDFDFNPPRLEGELFKAADLS